MNNLLYTIVFAIPMKINSAIKDSFFYITSEFATTNDRLLFALVQLISITWPSGTVWVNIRFQSHFYFWSGEFLGGFSSVRSVRPDRLVPKSECTSSQNWSGQNGPAH